MDSDTALTVKSHRPILRIAEAVAAVQAQLELMHQPKAQALVARARTHQLRDPRTHMPAEVVDRVAVAEHVAVSAREAESVAQKSAAMVVATTPKSRRPEMALPTQAVGAAAVHSAAAPITQAEVVVAASSLCAGHPTRQHRQSQHGRHRLHQRTVAYCHSDFRLTNQSLTSRVMM